jgi:hypothetical protein
MCETNPIPRLRIADCGLGTDLRPPAHAGRLCKTKPICPAGPGGPPPPLDLPPSPLRRRRPCKTNPIPGGVRWHEAPAAWNAGRTCETKPISPTGRHPGGESCKTNPICRGRQRTGVGRSCETKPICAAGPRGTGARGTRDKGVLPSPPGLWPCPIFALSRRGRSATIISESARHLLSRMRTVQPLEEGTVWQASFGTHA